ACALTLAAAGWSAGRDDVAQVTAHLGRERALDVIWWTWANRLGTCCARSAWYDRSSIPPASTRRVAPYACPLARRTRPPARRAGRLRRSPADPGGAVRPLPRPEETGRRAAPRPALARPPGWRQRTGADEEGPAPGAHHQQRYGPPHA